MDMAYSPHHDTGGSLHLPSPTHPLAYSMDGFNTINNIRRSMSRSPSRAQRVHYPSTTPNGSPGSPLSPFGLGHRLSPKVATTFLPPQPVSPLEQHQPSTARKPKFQLRRATPFRTSTRTKPSPGSPMRKVLGDMGNQANASSSSLEEADNVPRTSVKPHNQRFALIDVPIKFEFAKTLQENTIPVKSSPLKRSDGVMNLDEGSFGSPVAKRRSLHGTVYGAELDTFKYATSVDGTANDRDKVADVEPPFPPVPTRSSSLRKSLSLRKSTLQQRHTPSQPRQQSSDLAVPGSAASKARNRFSLDGSLPFDSQPPQSPFRRSTPLSHGLFPQHKAVPHCPGPNSKPPHPLAKALSPSSASSFADGTEPHSPLRQPTEAAPHVFARTCGFSKSLPLGADRPTLQRSNGGLLYGDHRDDDGASFSTPEGYKMAKPYPAAFMSTGLISKKNRNVELQAAEAGVSYVMPDTPSKRVSFPPMTATPFRKSTVGNMAGGVRHESGSPSSPFSAHAKRNSNEVFGKSVSIFGTRMRASTLDRKASFASIDADDGGSPSHMVESQSSNDEFPPTPTKPSDGRRSKENSLRSSLFGRRGSINPDTFVSPFAAEETCSHGKKSESPAFNVSPSDVVDGEVLIHDAPAPSTFSFKDPRSAFLSFAQSRLLRQMRGASSVPMPSLSIKISPPSPAPLSHTNISYHSATPVGDAASRQTSPHTPQDAFHPTDPSSLSISGKPHAPNLFKLSTSSKSIFPPATPTAPRDYLFPFSESQAGQVAGVFNNDIDTSLTSRFSTVVIYGTGEFSHVYRVEHPTNASFRDQGRSFSNFGKVWAVKKTKKPFMGIKDKQHKTREVNILRALRGHEHVIHFTDSWEANGHLYIQTEFCENGNLKDFLAHTGFKARLDDFRIWKILLELASGLKHIHDNNYIHLDLKPANVFIDWEGVLKIGDFGLASAWPAPANIDGEGDREYIGPEILSGRYDKPADVFSLGMILLEIAGNIILPDNGTSWQRLRAGDLSDLPSLTWSDSNLSRDDSGEAMEGAPMNRSHETLCMSDGEEPSFKFPRETSPTPHRNEGLVTPPDFMVDPEHPQALDRTVQWMICPDPDQRPIVEQLCQLGPVKWVERRRRAGATVYEGNYGPADDVLNHDRDADVDMMDAD